MKVYSPKDNHKIEKILFAAKLYGKELIHEVVEYDTKIPKSFKEAYPAFSMPAL